jgi:hypothetical protein
VLRDTRALMLNGFVLDELPGPLVVAAARQTRAAGGSVFFDPGAESAVCSGAHVRASSFGSHLVGDSQCARHHLASKAQACPAVRRRPHRMQVPMSVHNTAAGPRSWTLLEGQRREALDAILDVADVVLMTRVRPLHRPLRTVACQHIRLQTHT